MRGRVLLVTLSLTVGTGLAQPAAASDDHATRIVWTQILDEESTTARIVSARPDGGDQRAVSHPDAGAFDLNAVISPDGSHVVFERDLPDGSTRLVIVGSHGRGEHPLDLGCSDPCAADLDPSWTPDGRRIVFTRVVGPFDQVNDSARSAVLHTARLDGADVRRLSPPGIDGAFEDYHARFAPSGGYLTFVRVRNADIKPAAFRMSVHGTHARQLTPFELGADLADVSPARSGPTKGLVVFETFGTGPPEGSQPDIATVPADCHPLADCTRRIHYVTRNSGTGPAASFNPSWSPDGKRIAFTQFVARDEEPPLGDIWTVRPTGRDLQQVSTSPRFEFRPDWGRAM
jgi:Tol biopolymer transport system component